MALMYMCVPTFIIRRMHGRYYRRNLKKGNGRLVKLAMDALD